FRQWTATTRSERKLRRHLEANSKGGSALRQSRRRLPVPEGAQIRRRARKSRRRWRDDWIFSADAAKSISEADHRCGRQLSGLKSVTNNSGNQRYGVERCSARPAAAAAFA